MPLEAICWLVNPGSVREVWHEFGQQQTMKWHLGEATPCTVPVVMGDMRMFTTPTRTNPRTRQDKDDLHICQPRRAVKTAVKPSPKAPKRST